MELDELDRLILNRLQENARTSFSKIAKEAGVSEAAVFLRVKRLQKIGVIKAFRAIVSPSQVGKSLSAFILVKADPKKYQNVLEVIKKLDEVTEAYDVTGPYYLILKVDVADKNALAKVIDAVGAVEGVMSTETAIILSEVKENTGIKL
ncbi:MAG: Lrp/AsnC family transcriptional regulator [Candidatus Methanomethyliaceae archaeon]|nr:Lrp/AsnC family transcriptional regulator [Candidatus Methanomethyliaceae archaeon]MDW7971278.1 Lrp/AsnC family transcriptional regulator [Nitrososphaerota archaeon]